MLFHLAVNKQNHQIKRWPNLIFCQLKKAPLNVFNFALFGFCKAKAYPSETSFIA
jgi:hypothetical protein